MGNKTARTTQVSATEYYLHDLPSSYILVLKEVLGRGRFFKSIQCKHDECLVFVKVYFKHGDSIHLREHERRLAHIKETFRSLDHLHVWLFQFWQETYKAAYLLSYFLRQSSAMIRGYATYECGGEVQVVQDAPLKPSMDIFAIGCVIAELFLAGQPLFELSQLLAYRRGQHDPNQLLEKISDIGIRKMILCMIQLEPESCLSAEFGQN